MTVTCVPLSAPSVTSLFAVSEMLPVPVLIEDPLPMVSVGGCAEPTPSVETLTLPPPVNAIVPSSSIVPCELRLRFLPEEEVRLVAAFIVREFVASSVTSPVESSVWIAGVPIEVL